MNFSPLAVCSGMVLLFLTPYGIAQTVMPPTAESRYLEAPSLTSSTVRPAGGKAPKNSIAPKIQEVEVLEMAFASGVSSMTPVGRATAFEVFDGEIFFWTRFKVLHPPRQIRHVWYLDGEKVAEFPITLTHPRTRAWTHKRARPGLWRVEVLDVSGNIMMMGTLPVRRVGGR